VDGSELVLKMWICLASIQEIENILQNGKKT